MKKAFLLFSALGIFVGLHFSTSLAQPAPARPEPPPLKLEKITEKIYQVQGGSGANCGVFLGKNETLVIDAKMSEETAKQMVEEIKKISTNPIVYLVLTHSDGDHVNGLPGFPPGTKIIAHENTRRDLDEAFKDERLRAYLPQTIFSDKLELRVDDEPIWLLYFGPAHTSGDTIVFFPAQKVAFLGDLFFKGRDPLIHRHKNGSSFGLVKVLKAVLELDAEIFLSGHADKAVRSDVEALVRSIEEKQAQIQKLINEGKSLEEIKKIFHIENRPVQPGRPRWLSLPEIIYLEITDKK